MKELHIKFDSMFDYIADGRKSLEVRTATKEVADIQAGDRVRILCRHNTREVLAKVVRKERYSSLCEMLEHEDFERIHPECSSIEELLGLVRKIYDTPLEEHGVLVFELADIQVQRIKGPGR